MADPGHVHLLATYYSTNAPAFLELWAPVLRRGSRPLLAELPMREATRVLDVGSGVGHLLGDLQAAAAQATVVAVDNAPGMLRLAPQGFPRVAADVRRLPFAGGGFDVAVLAYVLHHMPEPVEALREVRRVLRPGGALGVSTWSIAGGCGADAVWNAELDAHGAPPPAKTAWHELMDTPEKVRGLLDAAGFAGVRSRLDPLDHQHSVDEYIALRCGLGLRFMTMPEASRGPFLAAVRRRLEVLDASDFFDRDVVISTTARAA